MDRQFNLVEVVEAAIKWYKPILVISLLMTIGTFVLTLPSLDIVPPKYESTSVIFPANLSLLDRPYLFESSAAVDVQVDQFGDKHDVDRLVAISQSSQVMVHVILKFNLIEHYGLNKKNVEFPMSSAISKFKKNYEAYKNQFGSVEIHVKDKDKELAADMANEIVVKVDEINKQMLNSGREKMITILEKHIETKQGMLDELSARLAQAGTETQKMLEIKQVLATEQMMKYSNILDQYKLITTEDISTLHVMEKAYPVEKEDSKRFIIIAAAFFLTLFFLVLAATIINVYSK